MQSFFIKYINIFAYIVVYICFESNIFPNHLCSRYGEKHIFLCKTLFWKLFVHTASLRSASRPLRGRSGAPPRHLSHCFLCKPFYKPKTYNYAKTFFIWFITSIKTVSKNTIVEKDTFLFKMAVLKPFVHRPPPSARGSAPSFVSLFSLQPFLG